MNPEGSPVWKSVMKLCFKKHKAWATTANQNKRKILMYSVTYKKNFANVMYCKIEKKMDYKKWMMGEVDKNLNSNSI